MVLESAVGALAHLLIDRTYAMIGNTAKAKSAFQDFLSLWKDADTDDKCEATSGTDEPSARTQHQTVFGQRQQSVDDERKGGHAERSDRRHLEYGFVAGHQVTRTTACGR